MAVTAEFRNEVKTAIAPWRSSKPRPPFSPGALLTIALVLSGDEEMTLEDMMESSSSTFSYYNYCTKGNALSALITLREKTELREYLHSASRDIQLPASISKTPHPVRQPVWSLSAAAARAYLEDVMNIHRPGSLDFLNLPPEIRDRIYHLVLSFPQSGLQLFQTKPSYRPAIIAAGTITKDWSVPFSFAAWKEGDPYTFSAVYREPIQQTLSLLLVNKQTFQEAFSCFYRNNVFVFGSINELDGFLRNTPLYRRQHITEIAFCDDMTNMSDAVGTMQYLKTLPNLRKLHIDLDERLWLRHDTTPEDRSAAVLRCAGVKVLKTLHGLEVAHFSASCPVLKSILKDMLESTAPKKGKDTAVEVTSFSRSRRAAAPKRGAMTIRKSYDGEEVNGENDH